jgi:tRNA pseudouridine55 synthase
LVRVKGGLVVVDKPAGLTSHAVVAGARRRLGTRGIGHAGTLDPMATGVLLLLVDEATKLSAYLTLETKAYAAEIRFGFATDTLDADGSVVEERALAPDTLDPARVEGALVAERARVEQVPPAVSAIQIGGERAYKLARRGEAPVLPPRQVRVERLELTALGADRISVELSVSKGYYVRSLARDLGERLGVPAHLSALRRTRSGDFSLADAEPWPLSESPKLVPVADVARRSLPSASLTAEGAQRARLGQPLAPEHFAAEPPGAESHAWFDSDGELVAIGSFRDGAHRVLRGFGERGAPAT